MNRPPTEFKRIAATDLRAFGTACLRAPAYPPHTLHSWPTC